MKAALITGVCGQDGAYLAELLLKNNYTVHGIYRPGRAPSAWRLKHLGVLDHPAFQLVPCDLTDFAGCKALIEDIQPEEFYNLASQSSVGQSLKDPFETTKINGVAVLNMLEAIRIIKPDIRFFQASSSEMFGRAEEVPQTENTPFHPRSPYATAKLYAHWCALNYRETHGIFAACGILFNHESPLRGEEFVARKISLAVARIASGREETLMLGNLDVERDWGYAREFVDGMYRMVQHPKPETCVLATNRATSVRQFTDLAFLAAGIELEWKGMGVEEHAIEKRSGRVLVRVSEKFYRPCEAGTMRGDASKAQTLLGWRAQTTLEELCQLMVREDLNRIKQGLPN